MMIQNSGFFENLPQESGFCGILRNVRKIYSHILTSNRFHALIRVVLLAKGIFYVKLLVSRKKLKKFNKKIFPAGR